MKKILGCVRRAVQDYAMIQSGDRIAVGVSGGKDSLVMYEALRRFVDFGVVDFELYPICINLGFAPVDKDKMAALHEYFASRGTPLTVIDTQIADVLTASSVKSPCSLCSNMRRGALCNTAVELGCNKLALGHHADDVLETFLLSMLYEGRLSTFAPVTALERTQVTVIRPMVYVYEADIAGAARRLLLPVMTNPCPHDKHTRRQSMKELVHTVQKVDPRAKDRMIAAIVHPERNRLWPPKDPKED